ncbi:MULTISPECIES: cyclopropane-fatty-acyl-phospholipid synthase family protein [unclassified Crossiella]|uniref:class I SAM-dependent methyltransferase n=1 Tax=unclassified Crossiella TaxID=2620835 RepID=UPI001FFF9935|nr:MULTISPECIES: cyclopropane-fatty-acyl-phospholipid synthase family protein [unclassified Crossiella]MCK2240878.1 cyclopropane-fatty-acyl-phospholipid synthase family protein [Crossiella sp. S99.2]MCK2253978.1 cyclopropane-fatty-acyl-phospholipid synthase family protein [Crossiella sp. S99.1]
MTTLSAGPAATAGRELPRPAEQRWPGLATAPDSPVRAWVAERLFRHAVRDLPVRVLLAGGERLGAGGPDTPVMRVLRPRDFFHRLGADAKIGFGESYMVGDWTASELADLLTPFAARMSRLIPKPLQALRRWVERTQPVAEKNTVPGARENIHRHYDLSNELFGLFLDPSLTYSAAWFAADGTDLEQAQLRKIDGILDYAGVGPGTRLLEIGTGWGALAIRAAERGAQVTSLTISPEQKRLAEQRIAAAGLSERITVRLQDYREAEGGYDAVVSVEMIEAVGREFWPVYFSTLNRLTRPGGRVAIQAITMPHDRMLATADSYSWIHKYIFPGGICPSLESIGRNVREDTELTGAGRRPLGPHYAQTLRLWRERFLANWPRVEQLGFDRTFRRMWEFYLAYSEAGFRSGYLNVWQIALSRKG